MVPIQDVEKNVSHQSYLQTVKVLAVGRIREVINTLQGHEPNQLGVAV